MSSNQQVAEQDSSSAVANTASSAMKQTNETVSSAAANLGGASSFSGDAHAGASSYKKTTITSSGGESEQQLTKSQADEQYEERMEDEYAKREGEYPTHFVRVFLDMGDLQLALQKVDEAHSLDPNLTSANPPIPYELHYAQKMTKYLLLHTPEPSPLLAIACRAQHFRRWEVPRDSYPKTKPGYFAWRTFLKKRQSEQVKDICLSCEFTEEEAEKVGRLIAKEDLKKGEGKGDPEAQVLEDVACLVFLDDQFDEFEKNHDEDKIITILQKTWVKMGKRGQDLALQMNMSERAKELVGKALAG